MITIDKPRTSDDWAGMREICCETAARPIPPEEREAFGRVWIGPYERWEPRWAYVAREGAQVVGYLTGCPSTARFLVLTGLFGPRSRLGNNLRFPPALLLRLLWTYPAHLHVNVLSGHRGGTGRALMHRFEADLRARGARGVHVFCGARPVGFYEKLGYSVLGKITIGEAPIFALGKRLG